MRWFPFILSFLVLMPLFFAQANVEEVYERGRELYWNNDSADEVIELFSQVICLDPTFTDAFNMWRIGELDKAQTDLDSAFPIAFSGIE